MTIVVAVVLAVEGLYLYFRDVRGPQARVSRRMQLVTSGASNAEILASLRRETSKASESILPAAVDYLETRLTQAGMRITANRMFGIMAAATLKQSIFGRSKSRPKPKAKTEPTIASQTAAIRLVGSLA